MKITFTALSAPLFAIALSACAAGGGDEPATTPSPTHTPVESEPTPEPEPTTSEVAQPEEPAEPAVVEVTLAPFEEPFTLTGPNIEKVAGEGDEIDPMAPVSTWEIRLEGHGFEDIEVDDMPPCPVVWGTATLREAAEGGSDAPPPSILIFAEESDGSWPEVAPCASNGTGMPAGYEVPYFGDGTRVAVGETYKFSTTTSVLDNFADPYLLVVLEAGVDQVKLTPPAQP